MAGREFEIGAGITCIVSAPGYEDREDIIIEPYDEGSVFQSSRLEREPKLGFSIVGNTEVADNIRIITGRLSEEEFVAAVRGIDNEPVSDKVREQLREWYRQGTRVVS